MKLFKFFLITMLLFSIPKAFSENKMPDDAAKIHQTDSPEIHTIVNIEVNSIVENSTMILFANSNPDLPLSDGFLDYPEKEATINRGYVQKRLKISYLKNNYNKNVLRYTLSNKSLVNGKINNFNSRC